MTEEELKEKVIRLEEQLRAAEKALELAHSNTHAVRAEIMAIGAFSVSMFSMFRK